MVVDATVNDSMTPAAASMEMARNESTSHPSSLLVPILALPGALLCLPPLALHVRARNMPSSVLVCSLMLVNLYNFTNAVIWPDDSFGERYDGVGLCDLEVKVFIGIAASEAGSTLCIFRQLSKAIDSSRMAGRESRFQKLLTRIIESVACFGIALCSMSAHYAVQPFRYFLIPVLGCGVPVDPSWAGLVIIAIWPPLLYTVAAVYAGLATVRLLRHRQEVSEILSASSTSKSYYVRLLAFASLFLVVNLPASVFGIVRNGMYSLRPYSWLTVHPQAWPHIVHALTWEQMNPWDGTDRYLQIAGGYIVFAFWGFGREARVLYHSAFQWASRAMTWHPFSGRRARSPLTTWSETSISTLLSKLGFVERASSVSVVELDDRRLPR